MGVRDKLYHHGVPGLSQVAPPCTNQELESIEKGLNPTVLLASAVFNPDNQWGCS
jgi:hypothetical protein